MGSGKTYIFVFMKMEKLSQEKYAVWEVRGLLSGLVQVDFGGVILAAIMQLDINTVWLFVVGTVIVALVVIIWGTRELRKDASKR